ncbi:MAG: beta-lactamase family protein [Acidibacter sp.]|jgi:CubicO group peptidase (beta-lactamase class C family)|nr:beta-lactamase family protein [Acidibacter sp.]
MKTSLTGLAIMLLTSLSAWAAPADDEAVYQARFAQLFASFRAGLGLETYDPLEAVPGARDYQPLRAASGASIDPPALQRAREYAAANRSSAFLVWRDGVLEESSYFGDTKAESLLTSRSLAKPMTAIAVGRAMALGKIRSLDQPVADFIPEWRTDERRRLILVRHLLDMRSGFLPQSMSPDPAHILNRAYLHPRHDDIIIREYPVVDAPGSRYEYNNASSEMVAVLIERATGRRYAEFISSEILQPIGAPGGNVWVNRPGGVAHSGCCLMLPAEAWLRLGILLAADGVWESRRLLPAGYVTEMRRPTRENPYYGLGVYVAGEYTPRRGFAHPEREADSRKVLHSEPYLAPDLFLFDGNANQVVYIIPSERLVILRMGDSPPRGEGKEWDNTVLPNTVLRGILRARAGAAPNGPDSR